jgi:hypothetical protein
MKETVEGKVVNLDDCGHFVVMTDLGKEDLHRKLKYYEDKKVRITIEERVP